jgi:nickel-dependent lactate racemase
MEVQLAYGRNGLNVSLPDYADVIHPRFVGGLLDEKLALQNGLRNPSGSPPLAEIVSSGRKVVIVHTDITRATPNERIIPVLLSELHKAGVAKDDITLLNGLGTHRPQTGAELRALLGAEVVADYRCLQHDCYDDDQLISLGETPLGHPVRVNKIYFEADIKILTGFVEPHFFAGFSGGPKAILPSLAGYESVFTNHSVGMIAHPKATWGVTEGNPIWEEMRAVALLTRPTFLLNVSLNSNKEITAVFAGDMLAAHAQAVDFVREKSMVGVEHPYDIVLTTNSGYPLDQNLYQSVKGMSAAAQIVKPGGVIIMTAACEDGLPDHGLYADLLREAGTPDKVLEMVSAPGFAKQDQWQIQIQALIQQKANVYVYSDGLSDQQIREALFVPCRNLEETILELQGKYGASARICVLPEGPQTVPFLHSLEK